MSENTLELKLDFNKLTEVASIDAGVIPCCVQDADSLEVLNIAYVNQEALLHSIKCGRATFWSTSRNELWEKGATSGDYLDLVEIRINCEANSMVYLVRLQKENQCHTQRKSCYYRKVNFEDKGALAWVKGYEP